MDGSLFYWISWMAWVCSTFLMKKGTERMQLSFVLLLVIILSPYYFVIGTLRINACILLILLYCLKEVRKKTKKQKLYLVISILTISLAYSSFLLFELYDPVWLFFNRNILLSTVLIYVTLMLVKDFRLRLTALLIGAIQGDILYGIVLRNIHFTYDIGSFVFLDVISISGSFIFVWSSLEVLFHHFDILFQKNTKEKHG